MKTMTIGQSNLLPMTSITFFMLALAAFFVLTVPINVTAGEQIALEGTLRGANCTHFKLDCPDDEAHIAMEQDFVLVAEGGKHYFLPNLNRAIKARHANREVRISGEREDHEIWVENFEVKKGQGYKRVWSWEEQKKLYESAGG